jgi:aminomethyltransferase
MTGQTSNNLAGEIDGPPASSGYDAVRGSLAITRRDDLGIVRLSGPVAVDLLDRLVTGDVVRLHEYGIRWTALADERGRVLADLQIYKGFGEFTVTCDRAVLGVLLDAFRDAAGDVAIEDQTSAFAAFVIEGPDADNVPALLLGPDAAALSLLRFTTGTIAGVDVMVGRIGYTGEFGYIFLVPRERSGEVDAAVAASLPKAVHCGPDVHDLLQLEIRAFNRRHDIMRGESLLEAGLHWMVDFRKPQFRGRDAIMSEKAAGLTQRQVAFVLDGADHVQRGAQVIVNDVPVGYVVNSGFSPVLKKTIGLAYVAEPCAWVGVQTRIQTLSGATPSRFVSSPFITTESTKRAFR